MDDATFEALLVTYAQVSFDVGQSDQAGGDAAQAREDASALHGQIMAAWRDMATPESRVASVQDRCA